jgi:hypothetical protein
MASKRTSDVGGEVNSNSVGANVKILWRGEELDRVHFPVLQVTWSFVGRLRDEAEKNEHQGMMTVDLVSLKQDGIPVFTDDFPKMYREVFVRRFVPCLNEKFNQRDPSKPLSKLPDDIGDSLKLLVICEKLKAAMKEDVKQHIDRLLVRSMEKMNGTRPNEQAAFKVLHATLEMDPVPPRQSLQEKVVTRAMDMLCAQLPASLDALQELIMLASELHRHEMCSRLFRAALEKALETSAKEPVLAMLAQKAVTQQNYEEKNEENNNATDVAREKLQYERERLDAERRELRNEWTKLESAKENHHDGSSQASAKFSTSNNESTSVVSTLMRQGLVMEKVGASSGERVVQLVGETFQWKKVGSKFTSENTVNRTDVVNVKLADVAGKTMILMTRNAGAQTFRFVSEQAAQTVLNYVENWIKSQAPRIPQQMRKQSVALPQIPMQQQPPKESIFHAASKRFPRISMSFSSRRENIQQQLSIPAIPSRKPMDFSFSSTS